MRDRLSFVLQQAERKHVYVESGDARLLMRYAQCLGRAAG